MVQRIKRDTLLGVLRMLGLDDVDNVAHIEITPTYVKVTSNVRAPNSGGATMLTSDRSDVLREVRVLLIASTDA